MKKIFLFAALLISLGADAMHPSPQNWHRGELILADNQSIDAELSYDTFTDLIRVRDGNMIKVYSARQISTFGYFDQQNNQMRRFVSLAYGQGRRSRKTFFEIVLTGELYLLRRLHPVRRPGPLQPTLVEATSPWYDDKNMFNYFVYADRRFVPLRQFNRQLYPRMMREFEVPLAEFVKNRRLDLSTQRGIFMLINQYNVLKSPEKISLF